MTDASAQHQGGEAHRGWVVLTNELPRETTGFASQLMYESGASKISRDRMLVIIRSQKDNSQEQLSLSDLRHSRTFTLGEGKPLTIFTFLQVSLFVARRCDLGSRSA
jgi:hypothetical protein